MFEYQNNNFNSANNSLPQINSTQGVFSGRAISSQIKMIAGIVALVVLVSVTVFIYIRNRSNDKGNSTKKEPESKNDRSQVTTKVIHKEKSLPGKVEDATADPKPETISTDPKPDDTSINLPTPTDSTVETETLTKTILLVEEYVLVEELVETTEKDATADPKQETISTDLKQNDSPFILPPPPKLSTDLADEIEVLSEKTNEFVILPPPPKPSTHSTDETETLTETSELAVLVGEYELVETTEESAIVNPKPETISTDSKQNDTPINLPTPTDSKKPEKDPTADLPKETATADSEQGIKSGDPKQNDTPINLPPPPNLLTDQAPNTESVTILPPPPNFSSTTLPPLPYTPSVLPTLPNLSTDQAPKTESVTNLLSLPVDDPLADSPEVDLPRPLPSGSKASDPLESLPPGPPPGLPPAFPDSTAGGPPTDLPPAFPGSIAGGSPTDLPSPILGSLRLLISGTTTSEPLKSLPPGPPPGLPPIFPGSIAGGSPTDLRRPLPSDSTEGGPPPDLPPPFPLTLFPPMPYSPPTSRMPYSQYTPQMPYYPYTSQNTSQMSYSPYTSQNTSQMSYSPYTSQMPYYPYTSQYSSLTPYSQYTSHLSQYTLKPANKADDSEEGEAWKLRAETLHKLNSTIEIVRTLDKLTNVKTILDSKENNGLDKQLNILTELNKKIFAEKTLSLQQQKVFSASLIGTVATIKNIISGVQKLKIKEIIKDIPISIKNVSVDTVTSEILKCNTISEKSAFLSKYGIRHDNRKTLDYFHIMKCISELPRRSVEEEEAVSSKLLNWEEGVGKRNEFFKELDDTERNFINNLFDTLNQMRSKYGSEGFYGKYETIYLNAFKITNFFITLDQQTTHAEKMAWVASIYLSQEFKDFIESAKIYFLDDRVQMLLKSVDLGNESNYILKRLPQHRLLIIEAIKLTPKNSVEHANLQQALKEIKEELKFLQNN